MSRTRTRPVEARLILATSIFIAAGLAAVGWLWREDYTGPASVPSPQVVAAPVEDSGELTLPKRLGSLRFAVMGDVGRGDRAQYDTAGQMARWHERFDFSFVLMLGDNIYAEEGTPDAYAARFERPYKALLDRGVTFYAALGNHDPPGQTDYRPFNMNGNRYYSFTKDAGPALGLPGEPAVSLLKRQVDFFALDTVTLDAGQLAWLARRLTESTADWKICFYHHPPYTSGRYRLGASQIRRRLEPIFTQYGVDVGLAGHEHFYERLLPQNGVMYFTSGGGGALRRGDIRPSDLMAAGYDQDTHFMLFEISGDTLYFQVINRSGGTVDQGRFNRVKHPAPPPVLRH